MRRKKYEVKKKTEFTRGDLEAGKKIHSDGGGGGDGSGGWVSKKRKVKRPPNTPPSAPTNVSSAFVWRPTAQR
jgi:hypothetical protein